MNRGRNRNRNHHWHQRNQSNAAGRHNQYGGPSNYDPDVELFDNGRPVDVFNEGPHNRDLNRYGNRQNNKHVRPNNIRHRNTYSQEEQGHYLSHQNNIERDIGSQVIAYNPSLFAGYNNDVPISSNQRSSENHLSIHSGPFSSQGNRRRNQNFNQRQSNQIRFDNFSQCDPSADSNTVNSSAFSFRDNEFSRSNQRYNQRNRRNIRFNNQEQIDFSYEEGNHYNLNRRNNNSHERDRQHCQCDHRRTNHCPCDLVPSLEGTYISNSTEDFVNSSTEDNAIFRRNHGRNQKSNNRNSHVNKRHQEIHSFKHNRRQDIKDSKSATVSKNQYLVKSDEEGEPGDVDDIESSQRDKLIQTLFQGALECMVCCEKIQHSASIWSCTKCFNILHLNCTVKWATSSQTNNGWRCPACQNVCVEEPNQYFCFCKKQVLNNEWNHTDIPHSCGDICNKSLFRGDSPCGHKCTLLCHPGPCPICEVVNTRYCGCGRTNCQMQCGSDKDFTCDSVCGKLLNCGSHQCDKVCHPDNCKPCAKSVELTCFCTLNTKVVTCSADVEPNYSCGNACNKKLDCSNHNCVQECHPGFCDPCYLLPEFITTCCCGKTPLNPEQKRFSCLHPIPVCGQICGKTLTCGELEEKHKCKELCHEGDCPTCPLISLVLCECRKRKRHIHCSILKSGLAVKCNLKCTVMRSCGKHKCNQDCCTIREHICPLKCNRKLRCGTHKCEYLCHQGPCPSCPMVSFEELACHCGAEVIFPPVPCGSRRPECSQPCSREHACGHTPLHTCHSEPECPPCIVFTEKWCHGHHQLRKNIYCHQKSFSCGQLCGKVLKCHKHTCNLPCHEGECLKGKTKCTQPCSKLRPVCGHPCGEPCHPGSCPGTTCNTKIQVTCDCGERHEIQSCIEDKAILDQLTKNSRGELKVLSCDDNCALIDRNRRLALGLQIRNPDLTSKLKPNYPDTLKQWAKKDPDFCNYVHSKLTDVVRLAKESKQKSRSFSFEVMNRDKRNFIHQYCEFFGLESVDCDPEPKRNVVVTAQKDKAWLPGYSLMETVLRDKGQLKVPLVSLNKESTSCSKNEMVTLGGRKS